MKRKALKIGVQEVKSAGSCSFCSNKLKVCKKCGTPVKGTDKVLVIEGNNLIVRMCKHCLEELFCDEQAADMLEGD